MWLGNATGQSDHITKALSCISPEYIFRGGEIYLSEASVCRARFVNRGQASTSTAESRAHLRTSRTIKRGKAVHGTLLRSRGAVSDANLMSSHGFVIPGSSGRLVIMLYVVVVVLVERSEILSFHTILPAKKDEGTTSSLPQRQKVIRSTLSNKMIPLVPTL